MFLALQEVDAKRKNIHLSRTHPLGWKSTAYHLTLCHAFPNLWEIKPHAWWGPYPSRTPKVSMLLKSLCCWNSMVKSLFNTPESTTSTESSLFFLLANIQLEKIIESSWPHLLILYLLFSQLDHQVSICLYLMEATALHHSREFPYLV